MSQKQIETATVIGTITGDGNVSLVVTAARMTNSPKTVLVDVVNGDTASAVAAKIKSALALDADVGAFFALSGSGADVVLTARQAAPNDATMNIALDNGTCTGLTAAPISAHTQAGDGINNGYCTLDEFKSYVTVRGGAIVDDAGDDAVIEGIIEAVSRKIELLSGVVFWLSPVNETRYFQPVRSTICDVDDLVSVATLSVDYSNTRVYTDLLPTDFELLPDNAAAHGNPYNQIRIAPNSSAYFPTVARGVRLSGKFGYPSVPANIKNACLAITHNIWMSRSGQTSGGKVSITAGGIVIRPEDIPDHVMGDLRYYGMLR